MGVGVVELGSGEELGLGVEGVEGVGVAALPDLLLGGGVLAVEAELLVAGGEGGGEGAGEVGEGGGVGARGGGGGGDDLADAEEGGLALDAGDEGDGVVEVGVGGAVLGGEGEGLQPSRDGGGGGRRGGGGRGGRL